MVVYNPITGKRRRLPKVSLNWKMRSSHSSTVAARMYGNHAMSAFRAYMKQSKKCLSYAAVVFCLEERISKTHLQMLTTFLLASSSYFYKKAGRMVQLDSQLLDIPSDHEEIHLERFHRPLEDITIDSFFDDNECQVFTRFTKNQLSLILNSLDLEPSFRIYYSGNKYFKFKGETLLIYTLRKWSSARTHVDLTREFGGCPSRWSRGYKWLVDYIDRQFYNLIGPLGLRKWAPQFASFAERLREYIQRDKERVNNKRGHYVLGMEHRYDENEFNVFGLIDCKVYEVCRPGSGPESIEAPSGRRDNWYIKQRAFYDGYHRGFEACVKILTICLPNGLTAGLYGPNSSRNDDRTMMHLSEFDDYLKDLCMEFYNGDLYCAYGDGIFAGNWFCCRSKHEELGGRELALEFLQRNSLL